MNKLLNPPMRRASAIAIAAALATFAGVAGAQARMDKPGYVVDSAGNFARSASGACIRNGQWTPALAQPACEGAGASARTTPAAATSTTSPRAAAPASAAAGQTSATRPATGPLPGYAVASGQVVQNGFGQCVRAGHWTPANAAEPCDRVAVARVAAPPPPVVAQAPEPKLEPAPAPQPAPIAQPAPQPAPIVQAAPQPEPPRMVIQKVTLNADLLFEFDKAQLRESGKTKLDELAAAAKDAKVEEIVATGYADPIGSNQYNEKLSAERAAAVKEYLAQKGVEAEKIKTAGKGETREFSQGCEKLSGKKLIDCFEPNRRVDVELLGSRQVAATESPAAGGATGSGSGAAGGSTTR